MKDIIKLVVTHFFVITVSVLFVISLADTLSGVKSFPVDYPWMIIITGIITALPSFLFYFKTEPTKKQFKFRFRIHFVIIESIVMVEGYLLGWYTDLLWGIIIFLMVLLVYAIVCIYTFATHWSAAKDINKALERFNEMEE